MPQLGELNLRLLCSRKVILICGALSIFGTFHIYTLVLDAPSMDEERMSATCREKYLKMPRKKAPTHILDSDLVKVREKLYWKRSKRVKEVCDRYEDARKGFNPYEGEFFIYDIKNRLAWCKTLKASHFCTQPVCRMINK